MGRNGSVTVYVHINPLTGKAYIGQTHLHPYLRWQGGTDYKYKKSLFNDFKKIGWISFKHIILEDNILTQEKADEFEKYYIKKYSNENGVYNSDGGGSPGGGGYKNKKNKLKIPVYQIDSNLNVIAEFSSVMEATSKMLYDLEDKGEDISKYLTTKEIDALIRNCINNEANKAFGYHWCKKSGYKSDWKPITHKYKIIQYDLNGNFIKEWDRAVDASIALNIDKGRISSACTGRYKTAGGFIFKYNGDTNFSKNFEPDKTTSKKVFQYDVNGIFIKEWGSIRNASKSLNINAPNISSVCTGHIKTAGGFIWKYSNNNDLSFNMSSDKTALKKVFQYDLKGNFIKEWESSSEASRELNINALIIPRVCRGKSKTAGGFIWKYEGDTNFSKNFEPNKTNSKKVFQYDLNGNFIKEWRTITEASRELNIYDTSIGRVCRGKKKTAGGFIWKYANSSDKLPKKVV